MERTMWNFYQPNHLGPVPTDQEKETNFQYMNNVSISPGRLFQNPNFVNNHPHIENTRFIQQPVMIDCHSDIRNKVGDQSSTKNDSLINSSHSILDTLKKHRMDIVQNSQMGSSRRRKTSLGIPKKINQKQLFHDLMETDLDSAVYVTASSTQISPNERKMLNLANFFVNIPPESSDNEDTSDEEDAQVIFSMSPNNCQVFTRDRQLSATDSEDDFIVFESGSDDELVFAEDDDSDEENDSEDGNDSDVEEDLDSSSSVIPCKRVRFAMKEELCQIHPMIQWSFAYRKARKGPWEEYARDRARFSNRIKGMEQILAPIFDCKHRDRMYKQRFQEESTD